MIELSEQQIIDQLAARMVEVYQQVEPTRVTRVIQEEYARFDERPIPGWQVAEGGLSGR